MNQKVKADQAQQQLLDKQLQTLTQERAKQRDDVMRKHMQLTAGVFDVDQYTKLDEAKNKQLDEINAVFENKERELKQVYSPAPLVPDTHKEKQVLAPPVPAYNPRSDQHPSQASHVPEAQKVTEAAAIASSVPPSLPLVLTNLPSHQQFLDGQHRLMVTFNVRGLPRHQKRRASSAEPASPDQAKRFRHASEGFAQSRGPSQSKGATITYEQVRRRATQDGIWDTIVKWPNYSQDFYVLYCEEHGLNFKQSAVAAAAKHMNGALHKSENRDWERAVKTFGHLITDCNELLQKQHNTEVEQAFKRGYVPQNKLLHGSAANGKKVSYPFNNDKVKLNPSSQRVDQESSPMTYPSQRNASKSKAKIIDPPLPKTRCIADIKPFHIYNCQYVEGEDDEDGNGPTTIWPVVVLGWDDLTPGAMRVGSLVETGLLDQDAQPPGCYVYSDRKDKILGWKMGTDGKPRHRDHQKKYPVMFFDDQFSYAWVSATDLSKLRLDSKSAPKMKGYKEKAFNQAREFIARREGYDCWQARETARIEGKLVTWYPGMPTPASSPSVWPDEENAYCTQEMQYSLSEAADETTTNVATSTIGESHHPNDMSASRQLTREVTPLDFPRNMSPDPRFLVQDAKMGDGGGEKQVAGQQEASLPMFELHPLGRKLTAKRTTKRQQTLDSVSTPNSSHDTSPAGTPTPIETPRVPPIKTVAEGRAAVHNPDANPLFELSSYHANDGVQWSRENAETDGIKLVQADLPNKLRSSGEYGIEVEIDAAVWECLETQRIPGNTQITLRKDDRAVRLIFDRKSRDLSTPHGKRQARDFIDWVRSKRLELGLQLQTRSC
ncbi:hypothetical protein PFICI_14382 [Pestalotiopsis fici W106-1]|uniref:Uncharacterized protein n=1 Tax=Pestalotiopsis fici (strain W106-1 / CGMCC3.15140) TaxID=1229662 RepID=W3WNW6_PESFW|nr:uncharacterized protein PFICI_14382 [Pestalotiopsis fici W106-1]ETS74516.1 hypothetical protein PFICI_14382 [Pestalotiopsis fici W106-1]